MDLDGQDEEKWSTDVRREWVVIWQRQRTTNYDMAIRHFTTNLINIQIKLVLKWYKVFLALTDIYSCIGYIAMLGTTLLDFLIICCLNNDKKPNAFTQKLLNNNFSSWNLRERDETIHVIEYCYENSRFCCFEIDMFFQVWMLQNQQRVKQKLFLGPAQQGQKLHYKKTYKWTRYQQQLVQKKLKIHILALTTLDKGTIRLELGAQLIKYARYFVFSYFFINKPYKSNSAAHLQLINFRPKNRTCYWQAPNV